jgi:potassium channel subfamily K
MSIILFFLASVILLSALLVSIDHHSEGQLRTEGFWFAVFTCILDAVCAATCLVNMMGVMLKKYPADLNLEKAERGLIVYTFILAVWFIWGAGMFSELMDLSYGNAMYYCVVSLLTIGLGDIIPTTAVSKAMALVYSLSGVIILGLIIAMIRSMVIKAASPIVFWSSIEKRRQKLLKKIQKEHIKLTQQQSFELMRSIRHQAKRHKENMSSLYALVIFMLFWLLGAMVFCFAEKWTYFDAVYFSLLCLLTIGYGQPAPITSAGRTFFILWALLAVPMMTALISSVGESLYDLAMSGASSSLVKRLFRKGSQSQHERIPLYQNFEEDEEFDDEDLPSVDQLLRNVQSRKTTVVKVKNILEILGQLIMESKNSPRTRYDYQEWNSIMEHLELSDEELKELGLNEDYFWLSNESPLSFPIREPDYLLFLLFNKLQVDVDSRTLELEQLMERIQTTTSQVTNGEKSHSS